MQRPAVIAIAICAGLVGLGGGYVLAQRPTDPTLPLAGQTGPSGPTGPSAPHDPDAPNAIAALATARSGAPVIPQAGGTSPLQVSVVSFAVALGEADTRATQTGVARACASAALDRAQAELTRSGGATEALETPPCGGAGAVRLEGRFRLSARPMIAVVGQQGAGAVGCDTTLRWQLQPGKASQELRTTAFGETTESACSASGQSAIAELVQKL